MKTLIIGVGALGGLIAARLRAAGLSVWLATRDAEQADQATAIAPLDAYGNGTSHSRHAEPWSGSQV